MKHSNSSERSLVAAIDGYNSEGLDALSRGDVLHIGRAISSDLDALCLPPFDSISAMAADQSRMNSLENVPTSTVTVVDGDGLSKRMLFAGDSGLGKSSAVDDMRVYVAIRLGLNVAPVRQSMAKFIALSVRYAALCVVQQSYVSNN